MTVAAYVIKVDPLPDEIPFDYQRCVRVGCDFCGHMHWHKWPDADDDGVREAPCSPGGANARFYRISFDRFSRTIPYRKENQR